MSFWRKFARTLFKFILSLSILGSVILVGLTCAEDVGFGFLLLLVFALLIPLTFCGLGMLIELCDNVADIRSELCKQQSNNGLQVPTVQSLIKVDSVPTQDSQGWICECGTRNSNSVAYCKSCYGRKR